jgi:hypothetical protein
MAEGESAMTQRGPLSSWGYTQSLPSTMTVQSWVFGTGSLCGAGTLSSPRRGFPGMVLPPRWTLRAAPAEAGVLKACFLSRT